MKGDWGDGAVRTPDTIRQDNMFWLRKGRRATKKREGIRGGGGVKKKLAQFNSCQDVPIRLQLRQEAMVVLLIAPPDPLHCVLLGPVNNVFKALHKIDPQRMERHYSEVGLPDRDRLYGGNFLGIHLKDLLTDESLDKLSDLEDFEIIKRYLLSLDKVHILATSKKLPPKSVYHSIMEEYRQTHKEAVRVGVATCTPKCHIVGQHFEEYFDLTGETLLYADTSNVEAVHHALKMSEQAHGSRTTKNLGSDEHVTRLKRSAVQFSSMNCGYIRRTKVPRRQARDPYSEQLLEDGGDLQHQDLEAPLGGGDTEEQVQLVEPDYFSKKIEDMRRQASGETQAGDTVSVDMDIEAILEPQEAAVTSGLGQDMDHVPITPPTPHSRKTKAELIMVIYSNNG